MPYKRYLTALVNAAKEKEEKAKKEQINNEEENNDMSCNKDDENDVESETKINNDNETCNAIEIPLKRKWTEEVPSTNHKNQSQESTKLSSAGVNQTTAIINNANLSNESIKSKKRPNKKKRKRSNSGQNGALTTSKTADKTSATTSDDFMSLSLVDMKNKATSEANNANKQFRLTGSTSNEDQYQNDINNSQEKYKWCRSTSNSNNSRFSKRKSFQASDKPIENTTGNFDYNNVDYTKFKGGAQRVNATIVKSKWYSKVTKKFEFK